jgi:hypothetical protein
MRSDKYRRMLREYSGFCGPQTVRDILATIPVDLLESVTGKQAGKIMAIRNAAYHEGISHGEQHKSTDGCVYIESVGLIPLDIIAKIKIEKKIKDDEYNKSHNTTYCEIRYTLDAVE